MPVLSAFTPFGQLEFSSGPSEAEKAYKNLRNAYRDPATGRSTLDISEGTYQEAKVYGWAMAIGNAVVTLRRAGNELRGETSYSQLEAHERKYRITPPPDATIAERRAELGVRQKAPRGPRYEAVVEGLQTILGEDLVAYFAMPVADEFTWPMDPSDGPGIFPRPDAVARSVRLKGSVTRTSTTPWELATYSESNQSGVKQLQSAATTSGVGQSLKGTGGILRSVKFYLKKTGSPTGNAVAKVYAADGTFGSDDVPTGDALATSGNLDVSALTTSYVLTELTFNGANQIELEAGTKYVVALEYTSGSLGNTLDVGTDTSAPTAPGNASEQFNGEWAAFSGDLCHRVFCDVLDEVAYENWNTRAAEIQLVKGDVLALDPGNWGLAEKIEIYSSSGTGTDRKFRAKFLKPHDEDCYATTGPTPLWMSNKRHVFVVVHDAASVDAPTRDRIHAMFARIMRGPTTWAIVQVPLGSSTLGPYALGDSPLGTVPIGTLDLGMAEIIEDALLTEDDQLLLAEDNDTLQVE